MSLMTSTGSIGVEEARTHRNSEKASGLAAKGDQGVGAHREICEAIWTVTAF